MVSHYKCLVDESDKDVGDVVRVCQIPAAHRRKGFSGPPTGKHGQSLQQMSFLVVEMVLPPGNEPSPANALDLLMLLNHPGGASALKRNGIASSRRPGCASRTVIPTASPNRILESVHA